MKARTGVFFAVCLFLGAAARADFEEFAKKLHETHSQVGCYTRLFVVNVQRCRQMDEVLALGRSVYISDDQAFVRIVSSEIEGISGADSYNYLAVLIATLSKDKRFEKPLSKLAEMESAAPIPTTTSRSGPDSKRIVFKYAGKSLERLTSGKCAAVDEPNYREVCAYTDPQFDRIRLLKGID